MCFGYQELERREGRVRKEGRKARVGAVFASLRNGPSGRKLCDLYVDLI